MTTKDEKHFELMKTLTGHADAVWGSCVNDANDDFYTASWDGRVGVWDIVTSENKFLMEGHKGKVYCVSSGLGSQSSVLVSGGEDKSIKSWSIETGECEGSMDDAHDGSVFDLKILPSRLNDKVLVLSVGSDAALNVWTLGAEAEPQVHNIHDHNAAAYTCAFNSSCTMFASGSGDTTVRIYDMETCSSLKILGSMGMEDTKPAMGHSSTVAKVEFFKDSPNLLLSAGWDSSFKVWDTRKSGAACVMTTENAHSEVVSCATSLGDNWVVTGSTDSTVKVWDLRSKGGGRKKKHVETFHNMERVDTGLPYAGCVQTLSDHVSSVSSLSVCAGGAQLLTTGGDRTVRQYTSCIDHNNPASAGCKCAIS